jgi:hypothetical protein
MKMKAYCYEVLWKNKEALETYNRVFSLEKINYISGTLKIERRF